MPSMAFNISSITRTKMVANRKLARLDAHWTSNDSRSKACLGLAVLAGQVPWVKKLDGMAAYAKLSPSPLQLMQLGAGIEGWLNPMGEEGYLDPVPNGFRWLEPMAELALRKTCCGLLQYQYCQHCILLFSGSASWCFGLADDACYLQVLGGFRACRVVSIHWPVWLVGAQCLACHFGLNQLISDRNI